MVAKLAIVGGSGFTELSHINVIDTHEVTTPYGEPSAPLTEASWGDETFWFLPRHGSGHTLAPHRINYRANLWALHAQGVTEIIALAATGGISENSLATSLMVPDQLIDYTHGRADTFADGNGDNFTFDNHIDFTYPYDESLRQRLLAAAAQASLPIVATGVYAVTQGPRLETAAEITRLARDGADVVGMTGMPEAALARELAMAYATISHVVNAAAGITEEVITLADILQNVKHNQQAIVALLNAFFAQR